MIAPDFPLAAPRPPETPAPGHDAALPDAFVAFDLLLPTGPRPVPPAARPLPEGGPAVAWRAAAASAEPILEDHAGDLPAAEAEIAALAPAHVEPSEPPPATAAGEPVPPQPVAAGEPAAEALAALTQPVPAPARPSDRVEPVPPQPARAEAPSAREQASHAGPASSPSEPGRPADAQARAEAGAATAAAVASTAAPALQSQPPSSTHRPPLRSEDALAPPGVPQDRAEPAAPPARETGPPPPPPPVAVAPAPLPQPERAEIPPPWRLAAEAAGAPRTATIRQADPPPAPLPPPRAVLGQVAGAIEAGGRERIEIRLDPPELGRVQIELRVVEKALHAVVLSERPEVQDLLRRHGEVLQRDLEAAGYVNVSLEFAAGRHDGRRAPAPAALPGAPDLAATPAAPVARAAVDGRLDIRL